MPCLIDTHCHLERFHLAGDLGGRRLSKAPREEVSGQPGVLDRALAAGIEQLITVATDAADAALYYDLAEQFPGRLFSTVGLHPCHVAEDWEAQVDALAGLWATYRPRRNSHPSRVPENPVPLTPPEPAPTPLPPPTVVAYGEIGLDNFHLPSGLAERETVRQRQQAAFRTQLTMIRDDTLPVVIHSRQAAAEVVAEIDAAGLDWQRVVLHCFTDGPEELAPVMERGGRASFTGVLTFKAAHAVRAAALLQGLDRLMLETDSPYLAPEPVRGRPCEPAYLAHTAACAATLFGLSMAEIATITTANARAFFRLPHPSPLPSK